MEPPAELSGLPTHPSITHRFGGVETGIEAGRAEELHQDLRETLLHGLLRWSMNITKVQSKSYRICMGMCSFTMVGLEHVFKLIVSMIPDFTKFLGFTNYA